MSEPAELAGRRFGFPCGTDAISRSEFQPLSAKSYTDARPDYAEDHHRPAKPLQNLLDLVISRSACLCTALPFVTR